jgi:cytochrome c2
MKRKTCAIIILLQLQFGVFLGAQTSGEDIYNSTCAACHTIGKGRLIGPDLSRIYEKRDQEWLFQIIRSSQDLIKEGDSLAVALYEEYNRIPMPDNNLSDQEIQNIIDYISSIDSQVADGSVTQEEVPDSTVSPALEYSPDDLKTGYALFYGHQKFSNGAASCFACHNIQDEYTKIGGEN